MVTKRKPTKLQAAKKRAMLKSAKSKNRKPGDVKYSNSGKIWAALKPGRPVLYSSPNSLWEAAQKYFQWCLDHPLYEQKVFSFQGEINTHDMPKMRAMSIYGLVTFLCINESTFHDYAKKSEDFSKVCMAIKAIMIEQKFSGAAADLLNASIIVLDLGLKREADIEIDDGDVRITYTRAKAPESDA